MERNVFETLSVHLPLASPDPLPNLSVKKDLDFAGKGKKRYASGYVIAERNFNLSKTIRNLLLAKDKTNALQVLQSQTNIFNVMCCSYDEMLGQSTDIDILNEMKRIQNKREGLTNISDSAFYFCSKNLK